MDRFGLSNVACCRLFFCVFLWYQCIVCKSCGGRCWRGGSHAVQPWAMLRCGGGPGVAPGAKTRGPLVRRTWRRSFVSRNPFECFAVIESVTRFECFTVTEFFTVIECFTVTGTQRPHCNCGEIVWSNEGASVRISSH